MAKDIQEFENKIKKIIRGKLPSLVDEAYNIANERKSKNIGEKLKDVYEEVLGQKEYKMKK